MQVAFLLWCQREAVGSVDIPCMQLTHRSTDMLLISGVVVRPCTQRSGRVPLSSGEALVGVVGLRSHEERWAAWPGASS